jgi:chorismate dehydratase
LIKVGQISYLNTAPFFHHWPTGAFQLGPGAPRQLAEEAAAGRIDASPLPTVECWRLENEFELLNKWGIASRDKSGSVFVLSRKPFAELKGATIGVTQDSSTSVMLCELLLKTKYGVAAKIKRGLEKTDDAWLVIGDQALGLKLEGLLGNPWSHITDLATEWWKWQAKPFVFARWVTRRGMPAADHAKLEWIVGDALDKAMADLSPVADAAAARSGFPAELVERYLKDFIYEIDEEGEASMRLFRQLLDEAGILRFPLSLRGMK